MSDLGNMLFAQLMLQMAHMKDGDPRLLEGAERTGFIQWNAFALTDEIHEAMAEVGWKPWASSNHVNEEEFLSEMVDAFHFFMNMLIAGSGISSMNELADRFMKAYAAKNEKNAKRQEEGYDGVVGKCPNCHRDLSEVEQLGRTVSTQTNLEYCTTSCRIAKEGISG